MIWIDLLLILALMFMVFNVIVSMVIVHELSKRGVKINFILLRLLIPKYVHQYKKEIFQETGKGSILFYSWIISINLALVLCVVGLLLKYL